jgi:hypothetical protein
VTEIQPYRRRPKEGAPLTGGARFIRGFVRLGIVLSLLTALVGIGISFVAANEQAGTEIRRVAQQQCAKGKLDQGVPFKKKWNGSDEFDLWESGCPGPEMYLSPKALIEIPRELPPNYMQIFMPAFGFGVAVSLAVAAIPLLLFWTVGWIANVLGECGIASRWLHTFLVRPVSGLAKSSLSCATMMICRAARTNSAMLLRRAIAAAA